MSPYWIRHLEKWKSDVKFVISDPNSPGVQSITKIVGFPKYYVRQIGSAILNSENPIKFITSNPKPLEYRVSRKSCASQNCMSDMLDIHHFAKGTAIWDRWDNFFLAFQLFRSPLIIVRIKSPYSFGSKRNYEKIKFPIFYYFPPNFAPYWISYWTKLNFDHGFLKSTPKTIRKHGFRLEIYLFQSWEWGLNIS